MKKGKSSQVTLKSHSSTIQEKEEIFLPPLDELTVCVKNLRIPSQDRSFHIITVTFFDQLLINDTITPIGTRDKEIDHHSNTHVITGTMSFDPSDFEKMCMFADNPLIVRIQAACQADPPTRSSCCNIDILPLFQGETKMSISKRMERMIEPRVLQLKSWDNLPLLEMELRMVRNPENKAHHAAMDAANVMKMTMVAACNVIHPYDGSMEYVAASKLRLSNETTSGVEIFKHSMPYAKRFSFNSFYPRWESISWENVFRKCEDKITFSLDDVQNNENINLNEYLNQKDQSNTVVWASFHRSLVLADDERLLGNQLQRYQWPLEFSISNEENGYSFMGFLDLFRLLYPGETTVRLAVPLLWMNADVMLEKCGCEPLLASSEKTPRSTVPSLGPVKETTATSGSAITEITQQPPPTGADESAAFIIVEVKLARPLVKPTIPPFIPQSEIQKMLVEKTDDLLTCTGRGQLVSEWHDTVTSASEALTRLPHYGVMDFSTFNRQLSKTRTRIELATSFWQEAAIYVNNYFVAQDFLYSDDTFQEMLMLAHACLVREASKSLLGAEPEQEHTLRAARQARQMQDTPHASELYLQLVTENENNANSWRELATCLMDEDVDLARVCINEALLLNPRHPLTLLSKGSMLYQEDAESAELFFTSILALYPFWTSGWVVVQAFYVERQEFLMADKIQQCIHEIRAQKLSEDLAPERGWEKELGDWWYPTPLLPSTNQFLEAADLLLRLRAMPLAEVCLARALSSCGMSPAYSHLLALACRLRGDVDNALCHLQEAFQSFGEVNYLRSLETECFKKQNDYNAALTSFEKAGNCVNGYSILNALPGREPQRARSVLVELLRRQPSAYAWMALADDWLMRQVAAGKIGGAGDADVEVAMSACAVACAEQALRVDRRFARAWALLAQLSQPRTRQAHCKSMATACGYKWFNEDLEMSGAQQSQCYLLSAALQECRCNLCETTHNPDCQHLECECVKWIIAAGIVRWIFRVQRIIDSYLEDVPPPERIVLAPPPV